MPTGQKKQFPGGQSTILTLDATTATAYTDPVLVPHGSVFAIQLDWQSAGDDLAATAEFQETCIPNPVVSNDTDWVVASEVSITAISATDTPAKELINIGNMGSAMFRLKFSRSAGSGTVQVYYSIKKNI